MLFVAFGQPLPLFLGKVLRTEWDSNPRYFLEYASFQDWYLEPLDHPSLTFLSSLRHLFVYHERGWLSFLSPEGEGLAGGTEEPPEATWGLFVASGCSSSTLASGLLERTKTRIDSPLLF
jgi:hypothetical protein